MAKMAIKTQKIMVGEVRTKPHRTVACSNRRDLLLSYKAEIDEAIENADWDEFLAGIKEGYYEQTTSWAEFQRLSGWRAVRIIVYRDGIIAGGGQALVKVRQYAGRLVYLRWGPCFLDNDPQVRHLWTEELNTWARSTGATIVVVNPCCAQGDSLVHCLKQKGYKPKKEKLPPWRLTVATLIIDLSKPLNSLFRDLRRERRREIRIGAKNGLTNKDRSCERSEPRSYPLVGQARH